MHGLRQTAATRLARSARLFSTAVESKVGTYDISGQALPGRAVYLDAQATTPLDPRVLDAMLPHMTGNYGNPHSKSHAYGWEAAECVEVARKQVADLIGADSKEVVFTSGATESNNMAVKGVGRFYREKKPHVITLVTEHKCVLDSCRQLQTEGHEVTYLPVQANGLVDLARLEAAITDKTSLVSVMAVNNEIGVLQPVEEIGRLCRAKKVFFHCDAAQAIGKLPVNVDAWNCDLLSISGHKVYGPKGIGALYVRRKPRVRLEPVINGGGQERGLRSGTLAHPLVAGLGAACAIAAEEMGRDAEHVGRLSLKLRDTLLSRIPNIQINGDVQQRYQGNLNISFAYVEGESLIMALKDIAISSGSACTSDSLEPSYVLRALGVEEDMAHTSIRFGIGRFTTEQEVDHAINMCIKHVERLREMSPLWEMVQDGVDLSKIQWSQH
ncbi:hypothetical protein KFE25_010135 [Diacronema lutheri]|uniref:cysteine desulfurase n=2 Tax=Diacronema lutheri TaxID=2081491 RepID=A0A8J6C7R9_DIALT|nr:hypothetical protein KFE25_010135 [Diacronema lutheri]